jgi:hypothetical protein
MTTGSALTWDTLTLTTQEWDAWGVDYPSWDSMAGILGTNKDVFMFNDASLYIFEDATQDAGSINISAEFTTPDFDMGLPDTRKTWYRFGLKLEEPATTALDFAVYGSVNKGVTWKLLTSNKQLTIDADEDEGFVNFRLTGSLCRFKLVCSTATRSYTISEYTFRYKARGTEFDRT